VANPGLSGQQALFFDDGHVVKEAIFPVEGPRTIEKDLTDETGHVNRWRALLAQT